MMRLRLKTKITLFIALLVLAVVGISSWLYLAQLTRQVIQQAADRAGLVTKQVLYQAQNALRDAAKDGLAPASNSPEDIRESVRHRSASRVAVEYRALYDKVRQEERSAR